MTRHQLRKNILTGLAVLGLFGACTDWTDEEAGGQGGRVPLTLRLATDSASITRAGSALNDGSLPTNSQLKVSVFDTDGAEAYRDLTYTVSNSTSGALTHSGAVYCPVSGKGVNVWAVYPNTQSYASTTFSVKTDQSSDDNYRASDLIFGTGSQTAANRANPITLSMQHKMAKVIVSVKSPNYYIGDIKLTARTSTTLTHTTTKLEVAKATAGTATDITVYGGTTANGTATTVACLVPPQDIKGTFLKVKMKSSATAEAGTATFALNGVTKELKGGYVYTVEVNVDTLNVGKTVSVTSWPANSWKLTIPAVVKETSYDANSLKITSISNVTYNGSSQRPPFTCVCTSDPSTALTIGRDIDTTYYNNKDVGYALLVVQGKSGTAYDGMATVATFQILPLSLTVTWDANNHTYDLTEHTITPKSVTKPKAGGGTEAAVYGTDYTVTNNVVKDAGTYTITVQGIGNCSGTYTQTYTVNKASLASAVCSAQNFTYDGTMKTAALTLKINGHTIPESEYRVSGHKQATNAGDYTASATALSTSANFTSATPSITWTINKADCSFYVDVCKYNPFYSSGKFESTGTTNRDGHTYWNLDKDSGPLGLFIKKGSYTPSSMTFSFQPSCQEPNEDFYHAEWDPRPDGTYNRDYHIYYLRLYTDAEFYRRYPSGVTYFPNKWVLVTGKSNDPNYNDPNQMVYIWVSYND